MKAIAVGMEDVPHCKRILNTCITVDCFRIPIKDCTHYFLSHFHSDHYIGLKKSFGFPVYCSETTAGLVHTRIGCRAVGMEMYKNYNMETFVVRLIEAHHCPGAVMFIFIIDGEFVLHTGDFRYSRKYHLLDMKFKAIYLDNTYETFLNFPSQKEAIMGILNRLDQINVLCPMRICVLCTTYCVGKERVFLSVAEYLNQKVQVTQEKMNIYRCYSKYTVESINREVLEIVEGRRGVENTFGFKKHVGRNMSVENSIRRNVRKRPRSLQTECVNGKSIYLGKAISHYTVSIDKLDGQDTNASLREVPLDLTSEGTSHNPEDIMPFDRITTEESPIKVIGRLNPSALDKLVATIYADKIVVLCGSGWKSKTEFRAYKRMDGRTIKNGIEIVYFRYSEHSSSGELREFKSAMSYETLINTVRSK